MLRALDLQVLSEYLAAKAAAVSDKASDKGSDKTGATVSTSARHATAAEEKNEKESPHDRPSSGLVSTGPGETAPAAPAPFTRPTTAPSLAQGVKEDAKVIWSEERTPARGPPPNTAAASDELLVQDLEEFDMDDDLGQVGSSAAGTGSRSRGGLHEHPAARPISMAEASALKMLVFGR